MTKRTPPPPSYLGHPYPKGEGWDFCLSDLLRASPLFFAGEITVSADA